MGRRRGRDRSGPDVLPDVDALLSGAARPEAAKLIALIHEVNPTDKGLPQAEAERRYRQKSALQSLLVRAFSEFLDVELDPVREGIISLRHRVLGRDAAHAAVDELGDDARTWVEERLAAAHQPAQGAAGPARPDGPGHRPASSRGNGAATAPARTSVPAPAPCPVPFPAPPGVGDLLALGRAAVEQYDFEEAGRLLRAAVDACGGGDPSAVRALLELLVDHLGADEEAAAFVGALPERVLRDPGVAGLLAVAAARTGTCDPVAAARHANPDRATEAIGLAVDRALAGDRPDAAREVLARARRERLLGDEQASAVAGLEIRVAAAEARLLGAAEALLETRTAGLAPDAAAEAAQTFLAQHPGSVVAARLLREARRRLVAPRLARLRADAEAALAGGASDRAATLLREVLNADPADEAALALAREADARIECRRAQAEEDRVATLLLGGQLREGLLSWALLAEASQGNVCDRTHVPAVARFSALLRQHRREPVEALAEATLAAEAAGEALRDGLPGRALDSLQPCWRLLRVLPDVVDLRREATTVADEQARASAVRHLAEATSALESGALEAARGLLARSDPARLDEEGRAGHAALSCRLLDMEARHRRLLAAEETWQRALPFLGRAPPRAAAQNLLAAIDAAQRLQREDGVEPPADRMAALREGLRGCLRDRRATGPDAARVGTPDILLDSSLGGAGTWTVKSDGSLLCLAALRDHVFVRRVEPGTGCVVEATSLRLPPGLSGPPIAGWTGERAWVLLGATLATVRAGTGDIESLECLAGLLPHGGAFAASDPGDCGLLWLQGPAGERGLGALRVVDAATLRVVCDLPPAWRALRVAGDGHCDCLRSDPVGGATLHRPDGELLPGFSRTALRWACGAARHPDGRRIVLVCTAVDTSSEEELAILGLHTAPDTTLVLVTVGDDGSVGPPFALPGSADCTAFQLAPLSPDGLLHMRLRLRSRRGSELVALAAEEDGGFREKWRQLLPGGAMLLRPETPGRSIVLLGTGTGIRSIVVGATPSEPDFEPSATSFDLPELRVPLDCPCSGLASTADPGFVARLRGISPSVMDRELQQTWEDGHLLPDLCGVRALAYARAGWHRHAADLMQRVLDAFPSLARMQNLASAIAADAEDWDLVVRLLPRVERCVSEETGGSMHLAHLRAVALLRLGRPAEAHETLAAALARPPGKCPLAALAGMAAPLPSPPAPASEERRDGPRIAGSSSPIRAIRMAVALAAPALARGDAAAALLAMDVAPVWRARELHSLAWLAEAWLRSPEGPAGDAASAFRGRLALCLFLDALDGSQGPTARAVPWAEGTWAADDLADLAARSRTWLGRCR